MYPLRKLFIIILLSLLHTLSGTSQCSYIYLYTQSDVDNFSINYPNCVSDGYAEMITIYNENITNLLPLGVLDTIDYIEMYDMTFENLDSISTSTIFNQLYIRNADQLTDITNLGSLNIQEKLILRNCPSLADLSGLDQVDSIEVTLNNCGFKNLNDLQNQFSLESLTIDNCGSLNDLSGLSQLTGLNKLNLYNCHSITSFTYNPPFNQMNRFGISNCDSLTTVNALQNLDTIYSLSFSNSDLLSNINSFPNLISANYISFNNMNSLVAPPAFPNLINSFSVGVKNCNAISTLTGFDFITALDILSIEENQNLTIIDGFENLLYTRDLSIKQNFNLDSISGFDNLGEVNLFDLKDTKLTNLDFLSSLKILSQNINIQNNSQLADISGIENCAYLAGGAFMLNDSPQLTDCCPIQLLLQRNILNGIVLIKNNGQGCSSLIEIFESCPDTDSDGIFDSEDNCINDANPLQTDTDMDGIGDGCDNCPQIPNPNQEDSNSNGIGDECDSPSNSNIALENTLGDTYITLPHRGLILKTVLGECYRITVNNEGDIETYKVPCQDGTGKIRIED